MTTPGIGRLLLPAEMSSDMILLFGCNSASTDRSVPFNFLKMKTLLIGFGMLLLSLHSVAQPNNPYNQRGVDYVASLKLITDDIKAGKVKEFSQEALAQYSRAIPLQTQVSPELVAEIIRTIKAPGFNLITFLSNSNLPIFVKRSLNELYQKSQTLGIKEFQEYLVTKTEEVNAGTANSTEKEAVLTNLAFASRATQTNCSIDLGDGTTMPIYGTGWCMVVGAVAGFGVGFGLCGLWCGIGGAVIGAVVFGFCN